MLPGAHQVAIVSGRRAQLQLWIERCARPHNGRNQDTGQAATVLPIVQAL
jgi:hypothetical protein